MVKKTNEIELEILKPLIKNAKNQAKLTGKPVKIAIGEGIRLNISKSSAVFQLRYRITEDGKSKERTLTLDKFKARTDNSINKAIELATDKANEAKELIRQGIDPTKQKQITKIDTTQKQAYTVKTFFEEWVKKLSIAAQWSEKHHKDMAAKFRLYALPLIGDLPLSHISRTHISDLLDQVSDKPATYKKVRNLLNMMF